jgi:hypothetical protein
VAVLWIRPETLRAMTKYFWHDKDFLILKDGRYLAMGIV